MIWVMFWNISRIYFSPSSIQDIESNCYMIFFKIFPIIFFWWEIYSFPVIFINKMFNLLFFVDLLFLHHLTQLLQHIESIYLFCRWDFLLFFYPIRRIYIWSTTIWIYFMTFIIQLMNIIEDKITTFHWFEIILISIFKWMKSSFTTWSASPLITISMFEYITRSSSLSMEEIYLFAIVNWIFHVSCLLNMA